MGICVKKYCYWGLPASGGVGCCPATSFGCEERQKALGQAKIENGGGVEVIDTAAQCFIIKSWIDLI